MCFWYGVVAWEINRLLVDAFLGLWDSRTTIYDGTVVSCLQYSMLHCLLHLLANEVLGVGGGTSTAPEKMVMMTSKTYAPHLGFTQKRNIVLIKEN